jgi:8-oxo-dGTP pyrophosphatase MutT (NUDIX family)
MIDLLSFNARICVTAGGFLVHQNRILLVKHKKLGIWLAPGGHLENDEQPHQTAEREVFEETNIHVEAVSAVPLTQSDHSQYLPVPLAVNLHWISQENYQARINSPDPTQPHSTPLWPKGCEQHLGYIYLVKPVGGLGIKHDPNESDGIDWFTPEQLDSLETKDDLKSEMKLAFRLSQQILNSDSVK